MAEANNQAENNQILTITSQYIKDFSFENITPMSQIANISEQPKIDVQIRIDVQNGKEDHAYLISLITEINAKQGKNSLFLLELTYTGEFIVSGFPANILDLLLRIECPRLLFPFVRSIVASTTTDGGFPPVYIEPIDFAALYQQNAEDGNQTSTHGNA